MINGTGKQAFNRNGTVSNHLCAAAAGERHGRSRVQGHRMKRTRPRSTCVDRWSKHARDRALCRTHRRPPKAIPAVSSPNWSGLFETSCSRRYRGEIDPAWGAPNGTASGSRQGRSAWTARGLSGRQLIKNKQPVWRKLPPLGPNCGRRGNRTLTLSMAQVAPGALYDRS